MFQALTCPSCGVPVGGPDGPPPRAGRCGACGGPLHLPSGPRRRPREDDSPPRPQAYADRPLRSYREYLDDEDDEDAYELLRLRHEQRRWEAARSKAVPAGVFMQVMGGLFVLAGLVGLLMAVLFLLGGKYDMWPLAVIYLAWGGFGFVLGPLAFVAGARMRALRSYGFVLAITIISLAIGMMLCGMLVGAIFIWPLVTLLQADVKQSFDRNFETMPEDVE